MQIIWDQIGQVPAVLLVLSIVLFAGFGFTRLTNLLRLPKVSGYILAGILIGPHLLGLIPESVVQGMDFVSDIALAFIAFGVGRFFKKETLRKTGPAVLVITLMESLLAGLLIALSMRILFSLSWEMSILLGAIATATAPASTLMTINQYKGKGEFVDLLLQVVVLDDVVCLLVFSVSAAFAASADGGVISASSILLPLALNAAAVGVGVVFALMLKLLLPARRSNDNRLIIVVAMLLGLSGLCSAFDVSPLLSCMAFGAVYINRTGDEELYDQINLFTPPIMLMFFVISGMNLDIGMLADFGIVGVAYFLIRIAGKYIGAFAGCKIMKTSRTVRSNLGFALIPQAGVAIGLAYLSQRLLPAQVGDLLMTIVLASSVLYELAGPACAKMALVRTGAIRLDSGRTQSVSQKSEEGVASIPCESASV